MLVVGGGPAGSSCAGRLARAGLDVVVLDRAAFPRDKVCAGWITPGVVEALGLDLGDYARGRVLQPITGFRTGLMGGRLVETRYPRVVSHGIRRCEFDHYLLARSGARVRTGAADGIRRADGEWTVDGTLRAPLLVGAGGHFCPVARHLGARARAAPVVAAQEVEFALEGAPCLVDPEVPELYFSEDLKGYGWCVRKGDFLNVGIGRLDTRGLAAHVAAFRDVLRRAGRVRELPDRWRGHAYLLYGGDRPEVVAEGALLIGDAAGLAYAASGEGIRPAVESGLLAADVILEAHGRTDRAALEPYRERLHARFGTRGRMLPVPLPQPLVVAAGRRLMRSGWFARRVILDRWFLRSALPPLSLGPFPGARRPAAPVSV